MLKVPWLVNDRSGHALIHTVLLMKVWGEGLYSLENRNLGSVANGSCGCRNSRSGWHTKPLGRVRAIAFPTWFS